METAQSDCVVKQTLSACFLQKRTIKSKLIRRKNDKKTKILQRRIKKKISVITPDCFNEGKAAKRFSAAKRQVRLMAIGLAAWYDGIEKRKRGEADGCKRTATTDWRSIPQSAD